MKIPASPPSLIQGWRMNESLFLFLFLFLSFSFPFPFRITATSWKCTKALLSEAKPVMSDEWWMMNDEWRTPQSRCSLCWHTSLVNCQWSGSHCDITVLIFIIAGHRQKFASPDDAGVPLSHQRQWYMVHTYVRYACRAPFPFRFRVAHYKCSMLDWFLTPKS